MSFTLCAMKTKHPSKLSAWMADIKWNDGRLAYEIKCSRSHVTKLRLGKVEPSFDLARRIHSVTEGKVTANDLMRGPAPRTRRASAAAEAP